MSGEKKTPWYQAKVSHTRPYIIGAWVLFVVMLIAGYFNAYSPGYNQTFIYTVRISTIVLIAFASALAFSNPALHRVRYRRSELFLPWLKRLFLVNLAFAIPFILQSIAELTRQLAHVPNAMPANIYMHLIVIPFFLYLPYACLGMGIGTLARQNWLTLIAGTLLSPIALYVLVLLPSGFLTSRLWYVIQSTGTGDWERTALQIASSLVRPVASLLLFGIVWRYALWPDTDSEGHRSDRSLTSVLMHKEFRLQKNNLLLTMGTLILSVFAVVTTYMFDFSYTGFDSAGVRAAFISCLIIPALVFVLPAMIGSTAAAAERAMDVWRWQGALPISWRRVMLAKLAVMALLVLGISGVLPYLTDLVSEDPSTVFWMFRDTWTYWSALLCCAIGFFAGSFSRDDYQGLMVSVGVLVYFVLISFLADPEGLVFPAYMGKTYAFRSDGWLVIRLGIIIALFLWAGSVFLKRNGINRKRRLLLFAAAMAPVIFLLTLVHLRQDRVLFSRDLYRNQKSAGDGSYNIEVTTGTVTLMPQYVASADVDQNGRYFQIVPGLYNSSAQDSKALGHIHDPSSRDHGYHYGISDVGLSQFYQTMYPLSAGTSPDKRWALFGDLTDHYALCGPAGININTRLLPEGVVKRAAKMVGITPEDVNNRRDSAHMTVGPNDLLLDRGELWPLIWKDALDYVTSEQGRDIVKLGSDFISHTTQFQRDTLGGVSALFTDKETSRTVWMGLGYIERSIDVRLASFAFDKVEKNNVFYRPNPESAWFGATNNDSTKRLLAKPGKGFKFNTQSTSPDYWEIDQATARDDGTTVSLYPLSQVVKRGDNEYAFFLYARELAVQVINRPAIPVVISHGVMVFNLGSGEKQYIPLDPKEISVEEFTHRYVNQYNTEPMSKDVADMSRTTPHLLISTNGIIAAGYKNGSISILQPIGDTWNKGSLRRYISGLTTLNGMRFISGHKLELLSNDNSLYTLTIP